MKKRSLKLQLDKHTTKLERGRLADLVTPDNLNSNDAYEVFSFKQNQ